MANYGFVYVLSNISMPGIYKIGFTERAPLQRADELSISTSIPTPFEIVFYGEVEDASSYENEMHVLYDEYRINQKREFFSFPADVLIDELGTNIREWCDHFVEGSSYNDLERRFVEESRAKNNGKS